MAKTEKEKLRQFDVSTAITDWVEGTTITKSDNFGNTILDKDGEPAIFRVKDAIIKICNHAHMMNLDKKDKKELRRIGRLVSKADGNIELLKDEYDLLKRLVDEPVFNQPVQGGSAKIELFQIDIAGQLQDVVDGAKIVGEDIEVESKPS